MTEIASKAARGTSAFMVQAAISGSMRIITMMVLTRLLIPAEMGQIAILGIIFGYMQFLGALGLNHASPLVIPEAESEGQQGRIKGFVSKSIGFILVFSAFLFIIVLFSAPLVLGTSIVSSELIMLVLIIVPFSALEVFLDSVLLARYRVRTLAVGRIAFDIVRLVVSILLVLVGVGVAGVVIGWLASELVAVMIYGAHVTKGIHDSSTSIKMAPILAFALPSLVFQAVDVTIQSIDRIILLHLTDLSSLGVYDVLLGALFLMSFVALSVSTSLYPILTNIRLGFAGVEDGSQELGRVVASLLRYIMILLLPISIIVSLNAGPILDLLFGSTYASFPNASLSFSILIVSYALWGATYALHSVLRSMGEARFFVVVGLAVIAFEILGCWYLTLWLGLLGSALIRSAYILLLFLTALGRIRQKGVSGLSSLAMPLLKIVVVSLVAGLIVAVIAPTDALGLLFWLALAFLLFIVMLFAVREVNELDFRLLKSLAPKSMHGVIDRINRLYFRSSTASGPEV
ncbi:MAG: oligosaccharide flippase family protein [Candidatus Thorarchaeota archaeon]